MTLYEKVTGWMYKQAAKHDLGDDYAERLVNQMSQYEFLQALSSALEEGDD